MILSCDIICHIVRKRQCCQWNSAHVAAKSSFLLVELARVGSGCAWVRCLSFWTPVRRKIYLCRMAYFMHKFCLFQWYLMGWFRIWLSFAMKITVYLWSLNPWQDGMDGNLGLMLEICNMFSIFLLDLFFIYPHFPPFIHIFPHPKPHFPNIVTVVHGFSDRS